MPRSRDLLLPPILQVLDQGCWHRQYSEGCSSVIVWVDPDPSKYKAASKRPQTPLSHLMRTIDLRDGDNELEEGAEHFSHIVCFPEESSAADCQEDSSIFQERRPVTAHGFGASRKEPGVPNNNSVMTTFSLLKMAVQQLIPTSRMDRFLRNRIRHQGPSN